ncbi:hypothetical protein E2562_029826 [Oryza meyeriana var. granulata]|uniref:Uncharacterized protein n=1 Tax=Oryza meyeriana var. granulata TaxID=110450 RepID=A0A6G1CW46_9ORYZ|nr:hypothetical protein E2562_029826 [Oryza meyeriana var. granulata]
MSVLNAGRDLDRWSQTYNQAQKDNKLSDIDQLHVVFVDHFELEEAKVFCLPRRLTGPLTERPRWAVTAAAAARFGRSRGATGNGRSDEGSYRQSGTVLPQDASQATPVGAGAEEAVSDAMAVEETEEKIGIWKRIVDEATRMQASVRAEALMDPDTLGQLVAPVEATMPRFAGGSADSVVMYQIPGLGCRR